MDIFARIISGTPNAVILGIFWGVMALGVYITYKLLDIADLSVDGSFATGGCVSALLLANGMPAFGSIGIAFLAGMAAGLLTGILHTKLRIPAILSGILTMLALYSINLRIMSGKTNQALPIQGNKKATTIIDLFSSWFGLDAKGSALLFGGILAVLLIAGLYWFFGTELGSIIRATGNNMDMTRAVGGNTDTTKILGLVLSNGFVALSGAIVAQQQRYGDVSMGTGTIVVGLASIIIGEVVFGKNRHFALRLLSVVTGSIIYQIVITIVLALGLNTNDMKLITAGIVAVALSAPTISTNTQNWMRRRNNQRGGNA